MFYQRERADTDEAKPQRRGVLKRDKFAKRGQTTLEDKRGRGVKVKREKREGGRASREGREYQLQPGGGSKYSKIR